MLTLLPLFGPSLVTKCPKPDSCPEIKVTLLALPSNRKQEVYNLLDTILWGWRHWMSWIANLGTQSDMSNPEHWILVVCFYQESLSEDGMIFFSLPLTANVSLWNKYKTWKSREWMKDLVIKQRMLRTLPHSFSITITCT